MPHKQEGTLYPGVTYMNLTSWMPAPLGMVMVEIILRLSSQDDVLVPVDCETVGRELLAEDVECGVNIFGPLVNDVEVGVSLDEATRGGTDSGL